MTDKSPNLIKRPAQVLLVSLAALLSACVATKHPIKHHSQAQFSELPASNLSAKNESINKTQTVASAEPTTRSGESLTHWEMSGAIAAHRQNKGWSATFHWAQQSMNSYQIRLFGPLGGGNVLIERKQGITTYRDGSQSSSARNADQLLQEKTGIALPVNNLYYWSRALPAPGTVQNIHRDAQNHIISFNQAGYTIEYSQMMVVDGMTLPKKISLRGRGTVIKVAIKKWKF